MRKLAIALLVLAAGAPAAAAPAGKPAAEPGKKRVCRPAAPIVGSHIKSPKVCRTAAEWDELDKSRRAADIPTRAAQPEPWERTRPQ